MSNMRSITAVAPAQASGSVYVSVTTTDATSVPFLGDRFTFRPTVTKLDPNSGAATGATKVTITGAGFAVGKSATSLDFGSAKAVGVTCSSTTTCTAVAPAHAAGKVVLVGSVDGISSPHSAAAKYTYR